MNLKYNILWFEDDAEVVNTDIGPEIKEFLNNLGFEYICIHKEDGKDLSEITNEKKYDLILTDLNLGDTFGNDIINHIRESNIFTEVLLYSANEAGISKIIDKSDKLIERVSFAVGLKNLPEKIKKIIELSIKKVQDVTSMRGIVIAAAIDLEIMMEDILKDFFKIVSDSQKDKLKHEVLISICDNRIKRDQEGIEKIKGIDSKNIEILLEENILTASNILDAMMSAIKIVKRGYGEKLSGLKEKDLQENLQKRLANIKSLSERLQNFRDEVINLRNTLAHVKEDIDESGFPCLQNIKSNGQKILFNDEKYNEIRNNFRKYKDVIKEVRELILN